MSDDNVVFLLTDAIKHIRYNYQRTDSLWMVDRVEYYDNVCELSIFSSRLVPLEEAIKFHRERKSLYYNLMSYTIGCCFGSYFSCSMAIKRIKINKKVPPQLALMVGIGSMIPFYVGYGYYGFSKLDREFNIKKKINDHRFKDNLQGLLKEIDEVTKRQVDIVRSRNIDHEKKKGQEVKNK